MEAQLVQQRANATPARPQQPTEAYAATLPVETLTRIFKLALQHFLRPNEKKGETQRVQYGLVCRTWCSAALPPFHYIISSSVKAQRLTDLLRTTERSRQAVRSHYIITEKDKDSGRGEGIPKLLRMCPNLYRLILMVERELCAAGHRTTDGVFGKPVQDALASLASLLEDVVIGAGPVQLSVLDSSRYFKRTLPKSPTSLQNTRNRLVYLALRATHNIELAKALIEATQASLRRLEVGELCLGDGEALLGVIKPVLGQLTTFVVLDGYALTSLSEDNNNLKISLDGYDVAELFTLLAGLNTLRYFTLYCGDYSDTARLKPLSAESLVEYLKTPPPTLQRLSLPADLA